MRSHLLWKGGKKGAMCKPMMQNKMRVFTIERSEFLLQKAILIFLFLVFILELNPVTSSQAAELRLYENTDFRGDYLTYYALQQNGCLTAWGSGSPAYFFRRTVARNVASFSCGPSAILYVDRDNVLWGRGSSKHLLLLEEPGRVRLMEDVKQAAVGTHHALALKTDGSLWSWGENNWGGLGLGTKDQASYPPQKILEGILDIFVIGDASFAITQEGTLLFWGNSERLVPEPIAEDVVSVSWLEANLYQYLTRQGSVYAMPSPFTEMPRRMIAKDVCFLCGGGFVKEDQSQWKWARTAGDGALVKVRDGVQAAASAYFYATDDGRLHWVKRGSALAPVSKSVRNITPVLRNTVLLLFLSLWLLRRRRKKVQPKGEFNNPQQENL